jgi:membrane-bound metal-dependent hydrolase YbcI (DUF457 family)
VFIPWHRSWTHSFVLAGLLGLGAAAAWGPLAGIIAAGALAAHVAVDQLGYLGSNLLFPFSRRRTPGLKLTQSSGPLPNFVVAWSAVLLIFWNLAHDATVGVQGLNPLRCVLIGAGLPIGVFGLLVRRIARRERLAPLASTPGGRGHMAKGADGALVGEGGAF